MDLNFIADENIPNSVIKRLRNKKFDIISIREDKKGIDDKSIVELSIKQQRTILTLDKDFGFLIYYLKMQPYSVILFRIKPQSLNIIYSSLLEVLTKIRNEKIVIEHKFIITDGKTLRIRNY
jgi:predicted nuclease of predicted toxin-antitoxin system